VWGGAVMRGLLPAKGAFFSFVFSHALGRFTHTAVETLPGYYWLEGVYKDLVVYPCSHTYGNMVSVPDQHCVTGNTTCR